MFSGKLVRKIKNHLLSFKPYLRKQNFFFLIKRSFFFSGDQDKNNH